MKLPRRNFLRLAAGAATLPGVSRFAWAQAFHAALVSLGKHLGLFTDSVQINAVYGISEEPMSAEEWKKQFVKPG